MCYSNIFDPSDSSRWVCGSDLNDNGYVGEEGETAACVGQEPTFFCPIGALQCVLDYEKQISSAKCPYSSTLNGSLCELSDIKPVIYSCEPGWNLDRSSHCVRYTDPTKPIQHCSKGEIPSSCSPHYVTESSICLHSCLNKDKETRTFWNGVVSYSCNPKQLLLGGQCYSQEEVDAHQKCTSGYTLSGNECVKKTTYSPQCDAGFSFNASIKQCEKLVPKDVCPLGEQFQCASNGTGKFCSTNKCVDKTVPSNQEAEDVSGNMLINDGAKDNDGLCLEQVFIYNGRKQRCKTPGVQSAWKDCCEDGGKALLDDAGSLSSVGSSASTISNLYTVAEVAYTTYTAQVAAGVSEAFAGELAASAAQQQMLVAFDPTSMAVAVAMYFIMKWLANACDQMDMETAMANSSGYCIEVGDFCKKEVKFIGCVQKAKSFCCFNSKLARIIQEQGRPQLTTINGFGTPTEPNCRGFTPEEFQRIDFSRIDLTEYVEELQKNTQEQVQENIQKITEEFFNKVK